MQTRSFKEYEDLGGYAIKLNGAIKNAKRFNPSNISKKWDSFKVTLDGLENIMKDILEIRKKLDDIDNRPIMDKIAKQENKNVQRAEKITREIRRRLNDISEKLQKEFLKKFSIAREQYSQAISTFEKKDKENVTEYSKDFRLMAQEAKGSPGKIPFKRAKNKEAQQKKREEHSTISEAINKKYPNVPYELFEKLATLSSVLSNTERDNTTNAIRAEIKEIKKVGPQVMVQVAQDTLDRLRHSAQLIQDIEDLDRIMGRNLSVYSKDPKLQKVAKLIDGLSPLLKQAKEEEEKRKKDLSDKSNKANNRVEFTQQALLSYSSAVVTKAPLPEGYTNMKARLKEMSRLFRKEDKKAAGRGR